MSPESTPVLLRGCTLVLLLTMLSANEPCRSSDGGFSANAHLQLHYLHTSPASLAPPATSTLSSGPASAAVANTSHLPVCYDGSPAAYYYRPCCDGADPLDFCNASQSSTTWFIVFEQNGWCFSEESCASRPKQFKSSDDLPRIFPSSWDGIFSIFGEQNPNFYKSYVVYVPHCSNDLFLSSCRNSGSNFCGRDIALAVVADLLPDMRRYGAQDVVFVGGAGIMHSFHELASLVPDHSRVSAICDGCILLDVQPFAQTRQAGTCTSDNCTTKRTLNATTVEFWNSSDPIDVASLQPLNLLLPLLKRGVDVMAINALFDNITLARLGAWPKPNSSQHHTWDDYVAQIASNMSGLLARLPYSFGTDCTGPHGQSLLDSATAFQTKIPSPGSFNKALVNILYDLLRNPYVNSSHAVDQCPRIDCDHNCNSAFNLFNTK